MNDFFIELFEYNHCQNQNLADKLATSYDSLSEKTTKLYSHLLNAHHIWNARIESATISYGVWDIHLPEDYKTIDNLNYQKTVSILKRIDLGLLIYYSNTKGQKFNNSVKNILFHIVNHSTYHRGQIAMEMRLSGLEPLATDYILYKR